MKSIKDNVKTNEPGEFILIKGENRVNDLNKKYCNIIFYKIIILLKKFYLIIILFSLIILFIIFIPFLINFKNNFYNNDKNNKNDYFMDKVSLSSQYKVHNTKEYYKTKYDLNNIRYHFEDLYFKRKIFKINYSYLPYVNIDKSKSYIENAINIFFLTGMLNITKLDYFYNGNELDSSNMNHIHLSMSLNKNNILFSSISIASILNTSSLDTYIHFHMIINNCTFNNIKTIIDLKKINNNVEFVFYNGKQAELDFGGKYKDEINDYSRILSPEIVNNTNKILLLHSTGIIAIKDLSEIYFFDLEDKIFAYTLDYIAGKLDKNYIFGRNNYYPNGGVCLINVRGFRSNNLYKNALLTYIAYNELPSPFEDILLVISNYKFKYMPLNYNCPQLFENENQMIQKDENTRPIKWWIDSQQFTFIKYNKSELLDAALNPIIINLNFNKDFMDLRNIINAKKWLEYAYLTGLYKKLKKNEPTTTN